MIYAAEMNDSGIVVRVVCAESVAWCEQQLGGVSWIEAWRDGGNRLNFPSPGFTYDPARDAFIAPKPYPSWVLNDATCRWAAPVPMPPGGPWVWDESTESWIDPELHD